MGLCRLIENVKKHAIEGLSATLLYLTCNGCATHELAAYRETENLIEYNKYSIIKLARPMLNQQSLAQLQKFRDYFLNERNRKGLENVLWEGELDHERGGIILYDKANGFRFVELENSSWLEAKRSVNEVKQGELRGLDRILKDLADYSKYYEEGSEIKNVLMQAHAELSTLKTSSKLLRDKARLNSALKIYVDFVASNVYWNNNSKEQIVKNINNFFAEYHIHYEGYPSIVDMAISVMSVPQVVIWINKEKMATINSVWYINLGNVYLVWASNAKENSLKKTELPSMNNEKSADD
ncbi:MAG: hypothetical protein QXU88_02065 [Candidatus Woesearchaeota archaeon]